jgi:choline kinase
MLTCVVLAAGRGSRLAERSESKPLCPVHGRALIDWVILSARQAGIRDFVVVTGYNRQALEHHLRALAHDLHLHMAFAPNDEWQRENGISVCRAQALVGETFVLLMADHVFDPEILAGLTGQVLVPGALLLAADFRVHDHPGVDLDDVTKLLVVDGRISAIGKTLERYNAFDTGIFLCTPALFDALAESQRGGDASLSGGVRVLASRGRARVMDVGSRYWVDVDDENGWVRAEQVLMAAAPLEAGPDAGTRRRSG